MLIKTFLSFTFTISFFAYFFFFFLFWIKEHIFPIFSLIFLNGLYNFMILQLRFQKYILQIFVWSSLSAFECFSNLFEIAYRNFDSPSLHIVKPGDKNYASVATKYRSVACLSIDLLHIASKYKDCRVNS